MISFCNFLEKLRKIANPEGQFWPLLPSGKALSGVQASKTGDKMMLPDTMKVLSLHKLSPPL
jgi:hypothetical protein